jgi:hypothetical protein
MQLAHENEALRAQLAQGDQRREANKVGSPPPQGTTGAVVIPPITINNNSQGAQTRAQSTSTHYVEVEPIPSNIEKAAPKGVSNPITPPPLKPSIPTLHAQHAPVKSIRWSPCKMNSTTIVLEKLR